MTPKAALCRALVLDVTYFEWGAVRAETLAGLGATVVKLKRPGTGEQGRVSCADQPDADWDRFGSAISCLASH